MLHTHKDDDVVDVAEKQKEEHDHDDHNDRINKGGGDHVCSPLPPLSMSFAGCSGSEKASSLC